MLVTQCEKLIGMLTECTRYYMDYSYSITKPVWIKQVEQFSSFFDKIKDDDDKVLHFKNKVIVPFFEENKGLIVTNIANDKGVIQDKFLVLSEDNDDTNELVINNVPHGLFLHIGKVYLPISKVYTETRQLLKKRKDNVPYLEKALICLYKICRCLVESENDIKILESNVELLTESLEVRDEPKQRKSGNNPMDMLQNMLGGIKFDQIGDMMKKVTSDENTSKEFNDIFGKVSDSLAKGKNPMDTMSDLIKQASVDLNTGGQTTGGQVTETIETTETTETTETAINQD